MSILATNASDVMRRSLLRIDDELILGEVDRLNLKATTKVSAVIGVPLRSLQQKRDVASFAASAPVAAIRAVLELLVLKPLELVVDQLGEHAESPSFDQLSEAVDLVLQDGVSSDQIVAVLAFAVGEEFPAAAQCRRLLEERAAFELPPLPEVTASTSLLVPKVVDDEVREQRRRRREEEKRKKSHAPPRGARSTKAKRTERIPSATALAPRETPAVIEIVRRRFIFTPSELETFDPTHPLVGTVVLAEVPFSAVDPLIPEQRSKIRPALVVAVSPAALLVLGIYSNPSPSRALFQPWRRLGLAHVSFIATERISVSVVSDDVEKIGRLSDEEWNSLF
jgi:hypothetical protein